MEQFYTQGRESDWDKICSFRNLYEAYKKARRGKRNNTSVMKFEENLLDSIHTLSEELKTKTYKPSDYYTFIIREPKERVVKTNSFRDKVVQHALCDYVLAPVLSPAFIRENAASQDGKGTHYGLDILREHMRGYYFQRKALAAEYSRSAERPLGEVRGQHLAEGWVLKCDVAKFFYRIQHDKLKTAVRKRVKDPDVLWLIDLVIDSTENPGIPIGNQSSQWFAVLYLSELDHFVKEKLGIKFYGRYMDDFYLIHREKKHLQHCRKEIERFVGELGLELNAKTNIFPLKNGIDYIGFHSYLTETGKVVRKIRRKSKNNAKRKIKKLKTFVDAGVMDIKDAEHSYQSWRAHAAHGNTHHLVRDMDNFFKQTYNEKERDKNGAITK